MSRTWAVGVGLAVLVGLTVLVLAQPGSRPLDPEARAVRQLRDASIREPEIQFIRASPRDDQVVCGLFAFQPADGSRQNGRFVSTPDRIVLGRPGNPAVQRSLDQHCRGMFPTALPAAGD